MEEKLNEVKLQAENEIKAANNLQNLDSVFRTYLGRKDGKLTVVLRSLATLKEEERRVVGKEANILKDLLEKAFEEKRSELLKHQVRETEKGEWIDITAAGKKVPKGHLHPLTQIQRKAQEIFAGLGFTVAQGPELETEHYNFDALNIPANHPVRDMWDTFWIKGTPGNKRYLLRTHTSPVQVRFMERNNPPLRIIAPGTVFRYEATDARHEFELMQLEGLMVERHISVANFKAILEEFYKKFFNKPVKIRLRPSYFPFVEPGFEVDMSCIVCKGKGCSTCAKTGWIEMMGAGMVHPQVFNAVKYNPAEWKGFAFGMGIDRLAMMKYKVDDIRLFRSGNLKFLSQL